VVNPLVYGSDAVGGVIIITEVSPNKPISVTANASYGNFNSLRAGCCRHSKRFFTYQAAYNTSNLLCRPQQQFHNEFSQ
jgi:outer membrane cobalamin receptor